MIFHFMISQFHEMIYAFFAVDLLLNETILTEFN